MQTFLCVVFLSSFLIDNTKATFFLENNGPEFRGDYKYYEKIDGWFKLHIIPAKWHEARERCRLEGADIAAPLDYVTNTKYIRNEMQGKAESVFIGIHSIFSHGDFYSVKGIPVDKLDMTWAPSAPSGDYSKRCVVLHDNNTISNDDCNASYYPYVCYKKSDNKTISDCGTIDEEYFYISKSHTCYKLHSKKKTWNDAFTTCSAEGAQLLVLDDEKELDALDLFFRPYPINMIISKGINNVYVGVIDFNHTGEWTTIHGNKLENTGYFKWSPGEPNNVGNTEFCGSLVDLSTLNDVPCETKRPFICEKQPKFLKSW